MKEIARAGKIYSSGQDDILIEAVVRDSTGGAAPIIFRASSIDHLRAREGGKSVIVLKSGTEIALPQSYEDLKERIFVNPDPSAILDLAKGEEAQAPASVCGAFSRAQESGPKFFIRAFLRYPDTRNTDLFEISPDSINWTTTDEITSGPAAGKTTRLIFHDGKGPDARPQMMLDVPHSEFMFLYNQARAAGERHLDLVDRTRRKTVLDQKTEAELGKSAKPLVISAYVRTRNKNNYVPFSFSDADVDWAATYESDSFNHGGKCVVFELAKGESPFNDRRFIVEMRMKDFMEAYSAAKAKGEDLLDMRKKAQRRSFFRLGR